MFILIQNHLIAIHTLSTVEVVLVILMTTIRTARKTCIRSSGRQLSSLVSLCWSSNLSKRLLTKTSMAQWRVTLTSLGIPTKSSLGRISCMSTQQSGGLCSYSVSSRCQMLSETSQHSTLNTCFQTWCGQPIYTQFTKCTTLQSAAMAGLNGSSSLLSWSLAWLQNRGFSIMVQGLCTSWDQTINMLIITYILPSSTFLTGLNTMNGTTLAMMTIIIMYDSPLKNPLKIIKS